MWRQYRVFQSRTFLTWFVFVSNGNFHRFTFRFEVFSLSLEGFQLIFKGSIEKVVQRGNRLVSCSKSRSLVGENSVLYCLKLGNSIKSGGIVAGVPHFLHIVKFEGWSFHSENSHGLTSMNLIELDLLTRPFREE